jgi:voltage-gated potassium channel Kch
VDPKDFHSLGDALWWAIVTLATVGYGDIVPTSPWGRVVGSAVIVVGVTFLSILTATVTSYFVSSSQDQRAVAENAERDDTLALLREILDRLDRLEAINPPHEPSLVARDGGRVDAEDEAGE